MITKLSNLWFVVHACLLMFKADTLDTFIRRQDAEYDKNDEHQCDGGEQAKEQQAATRAFCDQHSPLARRRTLHIIHTLTNHVQWVLTLSEIYKTLLMWEIQLLSNFKSHSMFSSVMKEFIIMGEDVKHTTLILVIILHFKNYFKKSALV